MPFWRRLLATCAVVVVVSFILGYVFLRLFGVALPSYLSGVVGGLAALPVWEFLKRIKPKSE